MRAGAVGGAVIGVPIVSLELLYRRLMYGSAEERKNATGDKQGTSCWSYISERLKRLVRSTCDGTLVALVGFCILRAAGYEGMLDPLHAVRVGAVGGVVICGSIMSIEWVAIALWCPIAACFCW
ncbi:hypothetical protein JAAARDRAFT_42474 [Jaapia argillacea MUCL 33604]|uniref:Uncharacterized protein n=1 Tax=Jaapia argillacea MUCL 33604 TaxID=933084 RepID=A0A067P854_9AGAM|nr:hypothetical protein JAAARDRAFT_42474 [Jaapia argillacea MUCL 33604]